MKRRLSPFSPFLLGILFLGQGVLLLKAGSLVTLADGSETTGSLTLGPASISVATGVTPTEINLSDVLEADFGEAPFQLDFFSSNDNPAQLPASWKAQDLGPVQLPDSFSYADGIYTAICAGAPAARNENGDRCLFAGQPWTGNGQWTIRVREIDTKSRGQGAEAGLMLRDSLDAGSAMFGLGALGGTLEKGLFNHREKAGEHGGTEGGFRLDIPTWLRLTRYGAVVVGTVSSDGKEWLNCGCYDVRLGADTWVGLFVNHSNAKISAEVALDQAVFTPAPNPAQIIPPGVLLQSGSYLAGFFDSLGFDPAKPDAEGKFNRGGKPIAISLSKIAVITLLPTPRSQIADAGSRVGLVMKNGDVLEGAPEFIKGNKVLSNSILLGPTTVDRSEVRFCLLHPVNGPPAPYEIRLRDGSILNATGLSLANNQVAIAEASGVSLDVSVDEIAQFRAGSAVVQSMSGLNWKATPPPAPVPAKVVPSPNVPAGTNAPAVTNVPAVTNAPPAVVNVAPSTRAGLPPFLGPPVVLVAPPPPPPVQCWQGPNQEQIIEAPMETTLEFPLPGKFHAVAMRLAIASDSPPASTMIVRVLADGKEITRTPPLKAGDQPQFMEVAIPDPKTVTLEADSAFAGTKALFIDPVLLRDQ